MKKIIAIVVFGMFLVPLALKAADTTANKPLESNKDNRIIRYVRLVGLLL